MASRIVAHTFVEGFSETNNTVNHIDGDVTNNNASNLEWLSQADNNRHRSKCLARKENSTMIKFEKVIYQKKYEFKTQRALAKFLGISPTQVRRYLEHPEKHELEIVPVTNCND